MNARLTIATLAGLVLCAGCGGDGIRRVSVDGRLTVQGQPLGDTIVQFIPQAGVPGPGGVGHSDTGGRFTLIGSRLGAAGVAPGRYRVALVRLVAADGTPVSPETGESDAPGIRNTIPAPYTAAETTPLEVEVPGRGGVVAVDLPVPLVDPR
jgi:hypothetical protein